MVMPTWRPAPNFQGSPNDPAGIGTNTQSETLLFTPDNIFDIGAASNRPRSIFAATSVIAPQLTATYGLSLNGVSGSASTPAMGLGPSTNMGIYAFDANNLAFEVNGVGKMRLDTNGVMWVVNNGGIGFLNAAINSGGGVLRGGAGAPSGGSSGDFYLRTDTPAVANQRLYVNQAGTWVGIL